MGNKRNKQQDESLANKVAPGIDGEDSYGEDAKKEMKKEDRTRVTRLVYDKYDPS